MSALPDLLIRPIVEAALAEDLGRGGDVTAALIPADARLSAAFVARRPGVAAGLACARLAVHALDPAARWEPQVEDGAPLAAARQLLGSGPYVITDLVLQNALVLEERGTRVVQVSLRDDGEGRVAVEASHRAANGGAEATGWIPHATATLDVGEGPARPPALPRRGLRQRRGQSPPRTVLRTEGAIQPGPRLDRCFARLRPGLRAPQQVLVGRGRQGAISMPKP